MLLRIRSSTKNYLCFLPPEGALWVQALSPLYFRDFISGLCPWLASSGLAPFSSPNSLRSCSHWAGLSLSRWLLIPQVLSCHKVPATWFTSPFSAVGLLFSAHQEHIQPSTLCSPLTVTNCRRANATITNRSYLDTGRHSLSNAEGLRRLTPRSQPSCTLAQSDDATGRCRHLPPLRPVPVDAGPAPGSGLRDRLGGTRRAQRSPSAGLAKRRCATPRRLSASCRGAARTYGTRLSLGSAGARRDGPGRESQGASLPITAAAPLRRGAGRVRGRPGPPGSPSRGRAGRCSRAGLAAAGGGGGGDERRAAPPLPAEPPRVRARPVRG